MAREKVQRSKGSNDTRIKAVQGKPDRRKGDTIDITRGKIHTAPESRCQKTERLDR